MAMKELLTILWGIYYHLQIIDQLAPTKQSARGQHTTQFTIFPAIYARVARHFHALRRPRGCGGRFLNTKKYAKGNGKSGSEVQKTGGGQFQFSGSQSSEVLQSEAGALNSSKETNGIGPNISGSEVTSMYSRGGLNSFAFNHLGSAVHSLADMIDGGRDIIMPNKWVAAGGNRCNLKS